jgi:hypothetical protein
MKTLLAEYTPDELDEMFGTKDEPELKLVEEIEEVEIRTEIPTPLGRIVSVTRTVTRSVYR